VQGGLGSPRLFDRPVCAAERSWALAPSSPSPQRMTTRNTHHYALRATRPCVSRPPPWLPGPLVLARCSACCWGWGSTASNAPHVLLSLPSSSLPCICWTPSARGARPPSPLASLLRMHRPSMRTHLSSSHACLRSSSRLLPRLSRTACWPWMCL